MKQFYAQSVTQTENRKDSKTVSLTNFSNLVLVSLLRLFSCLTKYRCTSFSAKLVFQSLFLILSASVLNGQTPGGVGTNLRVWLKADAGIAVGNGLTIPTWQDQSGNSYHVSQATALNQPTYYSTNASKLINFNPTLAFDGTNDFILNSTRLFLGTSAYSFLGVEIDEQASTGYHCVFSAANTFDDFSLHKQGGATANNGFTFFRAANNFASSGNGFAPAGGSSGVFNGTNYTTNPGIQPQLFGMTSINTVFNSPLNVYIDGYKSTLATPVGGNQANWFGKFSVGNYDANNYPFQGRIPEIMAFDRQLTDVEVQKINTYLAIKYGVTLGQGGGLANVNANAANYNYIATDGTVLWNATTNNAHRYNIAGIGRDAAEGLNQKQSQSVATGFQPIIALPNFAATNQANSSTFSADKSYEIWGSDNGAASFASAYAFGGMSHRVTRVWKVQETGTVGIVKVAISGDYVGGVGQLNLLTSSDATFDNSDTKLPMTLEIIGGVEYYTASVDLINGQYFTFGGYLVGPGGVVGADFWVKSDDAGAIATAWKDHSSNGNAIEAVGAWSLSAADANHNFHPYTTGFSTTKYFKDETSSLTLDNTYGVQTRTPYTVFSAVKPNGATGRIIGIDNDELFAAEPGFSIQNNKPYFYEYYEVAGSDIHSLAITTGQTSVLSFNAQQLAANSCNMRMGKDGTYENSTRGGYFHNLGENLVLGYGTWDLNAAFPGDIMEIAWYKRDLSTNEQDRVNSYLGIKNGVSLAINYLTSSSAVVWNRTTNTGFNNNIFGIGRDDASALNQKQAKSANAAAKLTIGLTDSIAPTNAIHPSTFTANGAFLMAGDNGATGWTSATFSGPCYVPPSLDNKMNKTWKVQETGDVQSVRIQMPTSDFTGNINIVGYPVYLILGDDATLNTNRVTVLGKVVGSVVNFDVNFPANSTKYFSFAGSNAVVACATCEGDPQTVSPALAFGFGCNQPKQLNNEVLAYPATGGNADITAGFKVTFPAAVKEYYQQCWPRRYGKWLQLIRYDNTVGAAGEVVFTTTFNKGSKPSFDIGSVDNYVRQQDEIEIIGYCGGVIVPNAAKTSLLYASSSWYGTTFGTVDPTATGGEARTKYGYYADPYWLYGTLHVEFTKNVDKIEVKWRKKAKKYTWKYYQYLYIGPMTLECPFVPSCTNEEQIFADVKFDQPSYSTCDTATMYLKLRNLGCGPKTMNLSAILPTGAKYVDSSFVMDAIVAAGGTVGTTNAYKGTNTLNWTGFTLPIGEFTLPIQVYSSVGINSSMQATFQISGGSSGQSDNSSVAGCQATPLVFNLETPPVLPDVKIKKDRFCYQANGEVNYTLEITNTTGSSLSNVNFNIPLGADFTIVNSTVQYSSATLTSNSNFQSNTAAQDGLIQLDNLTIPNGVSTIKFKAIANTSDTTASMSVNVSGDLTTACGAAASKVFTSELPFGCYCPVEPDNVCTGNKTLNWLSFLPLSYWNWGTRTKNVTIGDQQLQVSVTDAGAPALVYHPSWYPVSRANYLYIPRYDNQPNSKITTRIKLMDATGVNPLPAEAVDFKLKDIDGWIKGKDVVNVYGKLNGVTVEPKLTTNKYTAITLTPPTKASGSIYPWDWTVRGDVYVNFESKIDEIFIEYTKENTAYPTWKKFNDIAIGNINLTCRKPVPEVVSPDNVYIFKEVSNNIVRQNEAFTYKFTVLNTDCASKTINLSDVLPSGLTWIDSTLATTLTVGTTNAYGSTQNLSLTNITVPIGISYIYVEAMSANAGTFNAQAVFTVNSNNYLTDEPTLAGTANPTPVTAMAAQKANMTVAKAVNKTTASVSEVVKYDFTLTNNEATDMTVLFEDALDGDATFVAASMTALSGASATTTPQVNTYANEGSLTIRDLTIPANSTVTFSIDADVNTTAAGDTVSNRANMTVDHTELATYLQTTFNSNTVNTIIVACAAGTAAPALTVTTASNTCPATTVNLSALTASNKPAGTVLMWHSVSPVSYTNRVADSTAVATAGTYYASFYDAASQCFSTATTAVIVTINAPCAATFTFNCGTAAVNGTFAANAVAGQTGTVTVPMTGATAGTATFTVTGTGFTGTLSTTLTAGQASVSVPITYDGSGAAGTRPLSITSTEGTGTCSVNATVSALIATFTFNCGSAAATGTFVANATAGQSGSVTVPMTGATAGSATFTVAGTGFTGTLTTTLTAGQVSVSVPITYDGTGAAGARPLSITSSQGTGTCSVNATVSVLIATFTFNCGTATSTGAFIANATAGQTGTLVIPMTGATAGSATFTVTGTGFTGTLSTTLTAGQASVTIPITYDGTGAAGTRTLTITSTEGSGTCTKDVTVSAGAATFAFNCGGVLTVGSFVANGTAGQTGSLTIPMTSVTAGSATFTVSGAGFTGTLTTTLATGQPSVSVPITYDGTGAARSQALTITSAQGTGTCSTNATVAAPVATFTFNCGTATSTGTFTANATAGQAGTLVIPMTGATAGSATFTVTGTGFTGTLSTTLTAGQASVTIPITYNGTGAIGSRTLTVSSSEGTGTCTPSVSVSGVPDLTTTIGQPLTPLTVGQTSNIPITVANIGNGIAPGIITTTITLPAGVTAPPTFMNNGWTCSTTAPSVTCTNPGPIAAGGSSTFNVPVTPDITTVGTKPIFNATTNPVTGETNTGNNAATSLVPTVNVQPANCNWTPGAIGK
jgi:uncharacterized repeat protein (TIGR01451 family)